jgi:hypothetical protein
MTISKIHRDMLWDWNPAWGDQPADQHVREYIKQDEQACSQALVADQQAEAFYAEMQIKRSLKEMVQF